MTDLEIALMRLDEAVKEKDTALLEPQEAEAILNYIRTHGISGRRFMESKLGRGRAKLVEGTNE